MDYRDLIEAVRLYKTHGLKYEDMHTDLVARTIEMQHITVRDRTTAIDAINRFMEKDVRPLWSL